MTTREQYAVASLGDVTLGVQVGGELSPRQAVRACDVRGALAVLFAHRRADEEDVAAWVERYVRSLWPGRAYWIEVGDDESWVQVVEYGAFSGKPHKAHGAGSSLVDFARRVTHQAQHFERDGLCSSLCVVCEAGRILRDRKAGL